MTVGGQHPNSERIVPALPGLLILLAAFLWLYEPWLLGMKDFFRQEGFYVALAQEMHPPLLFCSAHGQTVANAFPFFPMLGNLLVRATGLDTLFALRLVSVAMTFLTGLLILLSVWRARNFTAAAMAAAVFWGSNIVIEKSLDSYPTTSVMFGLLSAQLLWLYIGQKRGRWNLAWMLSLSVLTLTFLAGGFMAVVLFFFPMIFLRRPLTLKGKLSRPGMLIGTAGLTGAILSWIMTCHVFAGQMPIQYWQPDWELTKYLRHLAGFPLDFAIRFLPWTLFAWAPFCVAFQAQDPTPIFSKYLRTLTAATFCLLWLLPDTASHDLLFLAAPFSMLCGMYYEPAVTRYAPRLRRIAVIGGALFIFTAALLLLFFCTLPESMLKMFVDLHDSIAFRLQFSYRAAALTCGIVLLGGAGWLFFGPRQKPLWLSLLIVVLAGGTFYYLAMFPYRIQDQETRDMARVLAQALEKDRGAAAEPAQVCKFNIADLYGECSLLNARVRKVASLEELPDTAETVYLLSTEFPQLPERNWTNLLPQDRTYRGRRICFWKGVLRRADREVAP